MYGYSKWMGGTLSRAHYRIHRTGGSVPPGGPILLVGNHTNGLIDGALLMGVTDRKVHFLVKYKLLRIPLLGPMIRRAGSIPVYRKKDKVDTSKNVDAFEAVYKTLEAEGVIGIFPEGSSHSEPQLQGLKTGTARMALGAEDRNGFRLGVRIVPVGIHYTDRQRYRSGVSVWVGEPIDVRGFATSYAEDPWEACNQVTLRVAEALRTVTINTESHGDRGLIALAAGLRFGAGFGDVDMQKPLEAGARHLLERAPERHRRLVDRLAAFRGHLDAHGVHPGQFVALERALSGAPRGGRGLPWLEGPLRVLISWLWAIPAWASTRVAKLPANPKDKYVTVRTLTGFVAFPLWGVCLTLVLGWFGGLGAWTWGLPPVLLGSLWLHPRLWERKLDRRDQDSVDRVVQEEPREGQQLVREGAALRRSLRALERLGRRAEGLDATSLQSSSSS